LILHQVASGEEADLKKEFPDEKDRVLSAQFLEKLLTNSLKNAKVHRHGVQIRNAIGCPHDSSGSRSSDRDYQVRNSWRGAPNSCRPGSRGVP
jgi:hypothetical protein